MSHFHNASITPTIESWGHPTIQRKRARCGFCARWFPTWIERLDHIAAHYRGSGDLDQSQWIYTEEEEKEEEAEAEEVVVVEQEGLQSEITAFLNDFLSIKRSQRRIEEFSTKDEMLGSLWDFRLFEGIFLESKSSATCGSINIPGLPPFQATQMPAAQREAAQRIHWKISRRRYLQGRGAERDHIVSRRLSFEGISAWQIGVRCGEVPLKPLFYEQGCVGVFGVNIQNH